jgi:Cytochrome c7 and related cytochrome c/Class III cytochrome C family
VPGKRRWLNKLIFLIAFALCGHALADGDFFNTKPGDLSFSHASLDDPARCNDCHVDGTKDLSNDKCLNCHDHNNLRDRINTGKGFHSSAVVKGKKCETCHVEHKGKRYDLRGWQNVAGGEKNFDHANAGWKLNGKHATTDCDGCHKKSDKQGLKVFMGNDRLCGSCHLKESPHKFLPTEKDKLACERCHGESVWKPAKKDSQMQFNHDDRKDASMPLLGSHKDVACEKCHPKSVFKLPFQKPDNCGNAGCHTSPHDGHLFGIRPCEWCHSPTFKTLKEQNFDHTANTKFDLGPAHKKIKCYDCHTKAIGERKPDGACEICHAKDSHHEDRFKEFGTPPKCNVCHPSGGPKFVPNAFNHGAHTRFKLEFKHSEISCRACHRGGSPSEFEDFRELIDSKGKTACMGCHAHAKVHSDPEHPNGKYKNSQCLQCHLHAGDPTIRKGKDNQVMQEAHGPDGTFPLVGGHAPGKVTCADCHTGRDKNGKTSFSSLEANCNANGKCHEDSLHQGTLGQGCNNDNCHKTPGFWTVKFDHDKPFPKDAKGEVSQWPLKGEHKKNKCADCHGQKRDFAAAHANCSAEGCHAEDDAHKGRLGDKCERCHVETGDNIFNHNKQSAFHLDGKHLEVRCNDCHPSITFKPRPTNCFGCHPEPKVHKGQYGTACEQCHSTRSFSDIKPLHDVGDFSLKGMHDNIACERCHKDNRPLAGSGNLCINCHRQDDIHNNGLSPRCGECHTQWSFAPARFDHSRVGCNLTGIHRTFSCAACHKSGNYQALSAECASCHRDEAVKVGASDPAHLGYATCANCHNPNFWNPQGTGSTSSFTAGAGGTTVGRESVCR